jgi:hypothetical protein
MSKSIGAWALAGLVALSTGCQSSGGGSPAGDVAPITSQVALFEVDASKVKADGSKDPLTRSLLAKFVDEKLSASLLESFGRACGGGAVFPVDGFCRSPDTELHLAWDEGARLQKPRTDYAVVVTVRPIGSGELVKDGSWALSTIGWLLCGIPGYVVDDYDYALPVVFETRIFAHAQNARNAKDQFTSEKDRYSTDYIDRNRFVSLPYVFTILIPPHVLSAFGEDDTEETAAMLFRAVLDRVAQGVSNRIREWERGQPVANLRG